MKRRIAFFDFDGTITTKDSFLEFIKFYRGTLSFYFGFILYSPFLLAYKLKIIPNYTAKQKVMRFFFKGENVEDFENQCNAFADKILPGMIRLKALQEIERMKKANATVVVVSASAENWLRTWTSKNELELLGTRLATAGGKITGSIDGINCYGDEKVCRIKERFDLSAYDEIYCYGDSNGDKAMLEIATFRFYKPFR